MQYCDSRTAYDDLSDEMKARLDGLVANHSLFHSRKTCMPEFFKDLDVEAKPMSKHKLVQKHEWSGRMVSTRYSVTRSKEADIDVRTCTLRRTFITSTTFRVRNLTRFWRN